MPVTLVKGRANMMDVLKVLLDLLGSVLVMEVVSGAPFPVVTRALLASCFVWAMVGGNVVNIATSIYVESQTFVLHTKMSLCRHQFLGNMQTQNMISQIHLQK